MAATDDVTCENSHLPLEELLKSVFTIEDVTGCIGIRTVAGVDSGVNAVDCSNAAHLTVEQLIRRSIVAGPNGPALRLLS